MLGLALCWHDPASATLLSVEPVLVELSADNTSATLTIFNQSPQPLRIQITSFAWDEVSDGSVKLAPTDDLIVFPTIFTVEPRAQRRIRAAFSGTPGGREKSYRLFIQELPPLESVLQPASGAQLVLRTKIGIPVFVQPMSVSAAAQIQNAVLRDGRLAFDVANSGTVHIRSHKVTVRAEGANGTTLFQKEIDGWYVLAGGHRSYAVDVPPGPCAALSRIVIQVETNRGSFNSTLAGSKQACRR